MVGGPRRSNEQSLPAYPFSQVQFPENLKQRNLQIIKTKLILLLTNLQMHIVILNSCNSSLYFIQKQITKIFSIIKNSTLYMPYTEISLSMFFSFLSTITLKRLTSIANSVSATVVLTKCLYCICYIRFCLLKSCVKNDKNRTLLQGSLDVNPCEVLVSCYLNIKQLYMFRFSYF